jgi:predicted HTH transcriptional regulator
MTPDELRALFRQPEGEQLEFKRNVPKDPRRVADAVAALANTRGGTLVIGFDEGERAAVGLGPGRVTRDIGRIESALSLVRPSLEVRAERVDVDGKAFIVVEVPPGDNFPYRADGRVLQRLGNANRPITTELAVERAEAAPTPTAEERNLAEAIAEQSQLIDELMKGTGWRRQLPMQLIFLIAGAVVGYILAGWDPFGFH